MPTTVDPLRDGLCQAQLFRLAVRVQPRAVGAFQDEQVWPANGRRKSALYRTLRRNTDIARDDKRSIRCRKAQAHCPGDMSRSAGMYRHPWQLREGQALSNREGTHVVQHACDQPFRVERQFHLLHRSLIHDLEGIAQHDFHQ